MSLMADDRFMAAIVSALTGGLQGYGAGQRYRQEIEDRRRREEEERRWRDAQLAMEGRNLDLRESQDKYGRQQDMLNWHMGMLDKWNAPKEVSPQQEQDWSLERILAQRQPRQPDPYGMREEGWWRQGEEPRHMQIPSGQRMVSEGDWRSFQPAPGTTLGMGEPTGDMSDAQLISLLRLAENEAMEPGEAVAKYQEMKGALATPFDLEAARAQVLAIWNELVPGRPLDEASLGELVRKYERDGPNGVRQWILLKFGGQ